MLKPWGGPLRDVDDPDTEAHGIEVAAAFEKHLDELYDSFPDDCSSEFLGGFMRAMDEVEVNLHYFIDGRLPRKPK